MSTLLAADDQDLKFLQANDSFQGASDGFLAVLLDHFAHPVMVASPYRQIIHTNDAARRELACGDVVYAAQNELRTLSPLDGKVLHRALAKAAAGERSLIRLDASGLVLPLAVFPLKHPEQTACDRIALFFGRSAICDSGMFDHFARSNGLTPTEELVLKLLCRSFTTPEIASQMDVAVSTVRSHVRNLCVKTVASGVRDLVSKVVALPPVGMLRGSTAGEARAFP